MKSWIDCIINPWAHLQSWLPPDSRVLAVLTACHMRALRPSPHFRNPQPVRGHAGCRKSESFWWGCEQSCLSYFGTRVGGSCQGESSLFIIVAIRTTYCCACLFGLCALIRMVQTFADSFDPNPICTLKSWFARESVQCLIHFLCSGSRLLRVNLPISVPGIFPGLTGRGTPEKGHQQ